jgi:hypothetical protein
VPEHQAVGGPWDLFVIALWLAAIGIALFLVSYWSTRAIGPPAGSSLFKTHIVNPGFLEFMEERRGDASRTAQTIGKIGRLFLLGGILLALGVGLWLIIAAAVG